AEGPLSFRRELPRPLGPREFALGELRVGELERPDKPYVRFRDALVAGVEDERILARSAVEVQSRGHADVVISHLARGHAAADGVAREADSSEIDPAAKRGRWTVGSIGQRSSQNSTAVPL